jgi:spermidine synthase
MVRDRGNVSLCLSNLRTLRRFQTALHDVAIYRHPDLGRVLVLNGEIQHVEAWAPLYHEPLVHLPAAFVRRPRTALVIGGGSFFAARELLKYRSIKRVLMLDQDSQLLAEIGALYEHAAAVRSDHRLEIQTIEAFSSLTRIKERFDLVVNDSVDIWRPKGTIFVALAGLLNPSGVCSDVVYRHVFDDRSLNGTVRLLGSKFRTALSMVVVPEYPGVLHLLTIWSESASVKQTRQQPVNREQLTWTTSVSSNPCTYYDPRFLSYYLHLPRCVRDRLEVIKEKPA